MNPSPLVSIITPCLNRAEFVAQAVESVLQQKYPCVEHIIVDGVSTDGTLDVLRRYPHLRVYSEPDEGMYDALNKGIQIARGKIIGVINTDDLYEPNILNSVVDIFMVNHDIGAVLGGATIFRDVSVGNQEILASFPPYRHGEFLSQATLGVPLFNAWFFRKEIFDRYGFFATQYRIAADRDFLIRLAIKELQYVRLDKTVYHYRHHPGSFTINNENTAETEGFFEDRAIAEDYISQKGIPFKQRRYFLGWHSQITTNQTLFALSQAHIWKAFSYAWRGWTHNFWWPMVFVRSAFSSMVRLVQSIGQPR